MGIILKTALFSACCLLSNVYAMRAPLSITIPSVVVNRSARTTFYVDRYRIVVHPIGSPPRRPQTLSNYLEDGSYQYPFKTIQQAINAANGMNDPNGVLIHVGAGFYDEVINITGDTLYHLIIKAPAAAINGITSTGRNTQFKRGYFEFNHIGFVQLIGSDSSKQFCSDTCFILGAYITAPSIISNISHVVFKDVEINSNMTGAHNGFVIFQEASIERGHLDFTDTFTVFENSSVNESYIVDRDSCLWIRKRSRIGEPGKQLLIQSGASAFVQGKSHIISDLHVEQGGTIDMTGGVLKGILFNHGTVNLSDDSSREDSSLLSPLSSPRGIHRSDSASNLHSGLVSQHSSSSDERHRLELEVEVLESRCIR